MSRLLKILIALPLAAVLGDTIQLKTGEVIEAKILATDTETITIQVQFSPTIVDQRIIARADIAHFSVDSGDEAAFEKIRDVKTPDTVLSQKTCETLINEKLLPFLKKFPSSPRAQDVQLLIRALRADMARLKLGDVKVAGMWYDKSAFEMEKYQIEAATVLDAMTRQSAAGNFTAAMNSFDLLQRSYPNSVPYIDAVPLAKRTVAKLQQQLNLFLSDLTQTLAERKAVIDRTPVEKQQPIKQAFAADDARAVAAATLATKNQQRFYPIFPYDEKGLKAMQSAATQTETQLKQIDPKTLIHKASLVRQVNKELSENEFVGAETTLAELAAAWPSYEALLRMTDHLKKATDANKGSAELAAKKKPDPTP